MTFLFKLVECMDAVCIALLNNDLMIKKCN